MKLLIFYIAFLINFFSNPIECDPQLKNTLVTVQQLDGANVLISKVLRDGPIAIKEDGDFPFDAYWDPATRTVGIASGKSKIYSLIFELQNAAAAKEFRHYDSLAVKGKISKGDYIKAIEHIEYQNTMKTSKLIDQGIQKGLFPQNSQLHYAKTFEEHYRDQLSSGHSKWIGEMYDQMLLS